MMENEKRLADIREKAALKEAKEAEREQKRQMEKEMKD